jgi:hypothetical protein
MMSLDYFFVKTTRPTSSVEDLEEDEGFGLDGYRHLGERLFPGILWDENQWAVVELDRQSVVVEAGNSSLTVRFTGPNADPAVISILTTQCRNENVLVIDGQTSEIIRPGKKPKGLNEYVAWYHSVLKK